MKAHQSDKLKEILKDQAKSEDLRKKLLQATSIGGGAERNPQTGAIRVTVRDESGASGAEKSSEAS